MRTYYTLSYLSEKAPPMLIIHGSEDQLVPLDQSTYLASRMSTFNRPAKVRVLDGVNHAFIGATEDQKKKIQEWIIEFAKENYRRTKP